MPIDPNKKVPARFVGNGEHILRHGPHFNADGTPFTGTVQNAMTQDAELGIHPHDELLVYPQEVYGQAFWHDPKSHQPSIWIGIGHVALPEHTGKSYEELLQLGYEFHGKSANFEPTIPYEEYVGKPVAAQPIESNETQPLPIVEPYVVAEPVEEVNEDE